MIILFAETAGATEASPDKASTGVTPSLRLAYISSKEPVGPRVE